MTSRLDQFIGTVAPRWQLKRARARVATELLVRQYDAAAVGRRTQGWRRVSSDANAAIGPVAGRLRDVARDLVRNNPYAESALNTIVDHTVGGWGIVPSATQTTPEARARWDAWANTVACDVDGRHTFAGLQRLVQRTVVESGEAIVRRRRRRHEDGLPLPLQLQVLEPDFLDTTKDMALREGGRIVQGVEFDAIGRRVAYWLFRDHPGGTTRTGLGDPSSRVPADDVLHIFRGVRPGQVRAVTWFAPVLLRFKDTDEFEDATLMKQKIAACLAVITSDVDGTGPALGTSSEDAPAIDELAPGMILNVPPGRSIDVVQPPNVREYADYMKTTLRAIAAGLGVTYEDLTGDYTELPFSAARMSRLRHFARVNEWRWNLIIPQLCDPVWTWAMDAARLLGATDTIPAAEWTAPPLPMLDPDKEGLAYQRKVRSGLQSWSEAVRELGYEPEALALQLKADFERFDRLGLTLDSDPRKMTQQGQAQQVKGVTR